MVHFQETFKEERKKKEPVSLHKKFDYYFSCFKIVLLFPLYDDFLFCGHNFYNYFCIKL